MWALLKARVNCSFTAAILLGSQTPLNGVTSTKVQLDEEPLKVLQLEPFTVGSVMLI